MTRWRSSTARLLVRFGRHAEVHPGDALGAIFRAVPHGWGRARGGEDSGPWVFGALVAILTVAATVPSRGLEARFRGR